MTQAAAETRLHGVKLETKASHEFNSKPVGIVVAQSPGGGTQTGTGDVVALTVSKGPHAVAVPNTVSLTEADAVAQLTDAGLEADVVQVPSNARAGTVVAQNPKGGTSVDPGSTVRLNVSKGRTQTTTVTTTTQTTATATTTTATTTTHATTTTATTTQTTTTTAQASVPDVVGSTLSSAVAQMRAERLLADSYPVASDEGGGTVVAQNPVAGTNVDAGLDRPPERLDRDRPPLAHRPGRDGRESGRGPPRAVEDLHRPHRVPEREQPGIVVGQLPAAGAQAKRWAQVIIYVGR